MKSDWIAQGRDYYRTGRDTWPPMPKFVRLQVLVIGWVLCQLDVIVFRWRMRDALACHDQARRDIDRRRRTKIIPGTRAYVEEPLR